MDRAAKHWLLQRSLHLHLLLTKLHLVLLSHTTVLALLHLGHLLLLLLLLACILVEMVRLECALIRVHLVKSALVLTGVQLLGADCFGRVGDAATQRTGCPRVLLGWDGLG